MEIKTIPGHVIDDMELRDNGVHEFYEDSFILVLRNHGEIAWVGMTKNNGNHRCVAGGRKVHTVITQTRAMIT